MLISLYPRNCTDSSRINLYSVLRFSSRLGYANLLATQTTHFIAILLFDIMRYWLPNSPPTQILLVFSNTKFTYV